MHHKALTTILGPKQGIPALSAARMERWALQLSAYSYSISYRPTKLHGNADGLSRLPVHEKRSQARDKVTVFNIAQIDSLPVSSTELRAATRVDPLLSKVLRCVRKGWPENVEQNLHPFWRKSKELTLEGDTLLGGIRIIVPSKLRERVLKELHRRHPGGVRMKALSQSHVWWPGLDKEMESLVKACHSCQAVKDNPPKAPSHPWAWPTAPWQHIHIDFAGPVMGKMLLIAVDVHLK